MVRPLPGHLRGHHAPAARRDRQALHRDAFFYSSFRNPGPVTQQGSLRAVSEFTRESGATRIVPGSHLRDEERRPRADEIEGAQTGPSSMSIA